MAAEFPERARTLKRDVLAPRRSAGWMLPACRRRTCLAFDGIGARGWSSYGWVSDAHGQMRRGWTQTRQQQGSLLGFGFRSLLTFVTRARRTTSRRPRRRLAEPCRPAGRWRPRGSTIEIRADLDAEMYAAVRSVIAQPLRHDRPGLRIRRFPDPLPGYDARPSRRRQRRCQRPSGPSTRTSSRVTAARERERRRRPRRDVVERRVGRLGHGQVRDDLVEDPAVRRVGPGMPPTTGVGQRRRTAPTARERA